VYTASYTSKIKEINYRLKYEVVKLLEEYDKSISVHAEYVKPDTGRIGEIN